MEPKQELSSIDLAALVTELHRYEGAKVDKAYLYGDDLLRLKLRDFDRGRVELLAEVGEIKRVHVSDPERVADAPGRPPNFAKMLRNRIAGADLAAVEQYEFDRILVFEFEREDQDTTLVVELFGEGNIAALDENGEVIGSLETLRLKSRTVAPGVQYEYPSSRLNPLTVGFDRFSRRMDESDSDVVRTLATQLNLGGLYAEEVCARAGIEKTTPIEEADDELYRAVYDALSQLRERLSSGEFDPRVYLEPASDDGDEETAEENGRVVDVTPFPLEERESQSLKSEPYDSFNAALDSYFHRLELTEESDGDAGDDGPELEEEIARKRRIIDQQKGAIEGFEEDANRKRRRAELLYENYDLVDEVLSTVQSAREEGVPWDTIEEKFVTGADRGIPAAEAVVDVDGSDGTVTLQLDDERVQLDADVGVERNADLQYKEAKRIEGKKEGALEAIQETREELERLEERKKRRERGELEADDGEDGDGERDDGEDGDGERRSPDWLARSSIPIRKSDEWYERFRWFHTSDGFLVIGGRNADQNEELVKKYMESNDRFFHAQAHGGPVTVLKATGPSERSREVEFPETSLEEAAQFAVSYSSVWKDGRGAGDAYAVSPEQVSKTPESGEYLEKGGFAIRGDRTYYRDVPAEVAVGVQVEPQSRVLGGPPSAIEPRTATSIRLRPGKYAQNDAAMLCYRELKDRFTDQSFVRKVASADRIQEFLPPGGSQLVE
ncbi:fibronectin-binding A domain protein [Halalkaliarchaeum desulfuricum]|uniref:Archaeal Rqc2 homolog aRqcH n=1 Tax=Halalkaliarchaeum desulfuricum TaxID=2055893 RepID=A0A343TFI3_9EURY|nr:ribosome rescue protein RqcH [Halalkaliarchaeum desulfuricum]AUX07855.1 fibronectin-binding A domain protein [Halalkaliarchaeum desulfuricum]